MASIAVLPILIGLAVDYAIQFQARFAEARAGGSSPPARGGRGRGARGGPVIGDRGAGDDGRLPRPAALADPDDPRLRGPARGRDRDRVRRSRSPPGWRCSRSRARPAPPVTPAASGRFAKVRGRQATRPARGWGGSAAGRSRSRSPRPAGCWRRARARRRRLGRRHAGEVISDLRELVPSDLPELQNVDELQETTGVSGEVEVAVRADDITDPAVVAWMSWRRRRRPGRRRPPAHR